VGDEDKKGEIYLPVIACAMISDLVEELCTAWAIDSAVDVEVSPVVNCDTRISQSCRTAIISVGLVLSAELEVVSGYPLPRSSNRNPELTFTGRFVLLYRPVRKPEDKGESSVIKFSSSILIREKTSVPSMERDSGTEVDESGISLSILNGQSRSAMNNSSSVIPPLITSPSSEITISLYV